MMEYNREGRASRIPHAHYERAPFYASIPTPDAQESERTEMPSDFTPFSRLPPEIRSQIWKWKSPYKSLHRELNHSYPETIETFVQIPFQLVHRKAALTPRIIKWVRRNDENIFSVPANSLPIFDVCHEARDVALLYGQYRNISSNPTPLLFSPVLDYLFFDARWIDLVRDGPPVVLGSEQSFDPLDHILPQFEEIRRIMVHPNYTNKRKKPTTIFSKLPQLEEILIGADEKSMGAQSKFLLSTVYDTKMYYAARVKRDNPNAKVPRIAIGCLGWRGAERMSMQHGDEDNRKIVGVFRKESEMLLHMRAEEWRFIRESHKYGRPKLTLRRRQPVPGAEVILPASESNNAPEET